jgi:hypothetical protein
MRFSTQNDELSCRAATLTGTGASCQHQRTFEARVSVMTTLLHVSDSDRHFVLEAASVVYSIKIGRCFRNYLSYPRAGRIRSVLLEDPDEFRGQVLACAAYVHGHRLACGLRARKRAREVCG